MKLLNSIPELATLEGPLVLVPGTMDGVHRGHQALIYCAREEAKKLGGTAVVMTFDQHPSTLLRPDKAPRLLTSTAQKLSLLEQLGVEKVLLLSFDQKLAVTSAEEFIQQLVEQNLKAICVGEEWIFGRGGKGNIALLHRLGEQLKFSVIRIEPVEVGNIRISSTNLRQAIASGNLIDAAAGLGRRYAIAGFVIEGAGRGKKIGYPTANLFIQKAQLPPFGVYIVRAHTHGKIFSGVANIGVRPTVQNLLSHSTEAQKGFLARCVTVAKAGIGVPRIAPTLSSCAPLIDSLAPARLALRTACSSLSQGGPASAMPCASSVLANMKEDSAIENMMTTVEVHLFDFTGDLYGEEIIVELLSFLRPEKKFSSLEELKAQIRVDVEMAKNSV